MREAEKLCDRVAIMHHGRILAEGTLGELRDRHREADLEELFFQLISNFQEEPGALSGNAVHSVPSASQASAAKCG
jgi:sodium transport system ATP-binding protein